MHNASSIGVGSQSPVLVGMVYSVTKGRLPQKEMGELVGSPPRANISRAAPGVPLTTDR